MITKVEAVNELVQVLSKAANESKMVEWMRENGWTEEMVEDAIAAAAYQVCLKSVHRVTTEFAKTFTNAPGQGDPVKVGR